jgi:hypothetical protein
MKTATLEIIDPNLVIKPPIVGTYCVRIYDDGEDMGGSFFNTIEAAEKYIREYQFDPAAVGQDKFRQWRLPGAGPAGRQRDEDEDLKDAE